MSMDGAHAQTNSDQSTHEIVDFLKTGIHNGQLSEYTTHVDNSVAGSQLSMTDRVNLSNSVGEMLQREGLLPRATADFSKDNFDNLSNGDKNISTLDLDNIINAGIEATSPVKGMFARTLRNNIETIAMAHQDTHTRDGEDPSVDKEVAKGISRKDLEKWGQKISDSRFHTDMSRSMVSNFGITEKWNGLAGTDGLLSKDELKSAQLDTIKYDSGERASLNYMRENFRGIKASRSGDSTFKMSLSDIHDWSAKHGVKVDQSLPLESKSLDTSIDPKDVIGSTTNLGLNSIALGLQDGNLTSSIRQFDQEMMSNGLKPADIATVSSNIFRELSSKDLMKRVMGQYAAENFDQMKGDNKYIHSSELDSILLSAESRNHPTERMIVDQLKQNSNEIALANNDVANDDSDRAEQRRGISLKDATKYRDGEIELRQHKDMSANMLGFFGSQEDFIRLAGGINDISDQDFAKLEHNQLSKYEFDEAFNISKDELEAAREDTVRFSEEERNTIHYMRENYGDIKSATSGDGRRITLSDLVGHAKNNGITMDMLVPDSLQQQAHHSEIDQSALATEAPKQADLAQRAGEEAQSNRWQKAPQSNDKSWNTKEQQTDAKPKLDGSVQHDQVRDRVRPSDARIGAPNETTRIKIQRGERIWDIAKQKYGTHAIEAIFEANRMSPDVGKTKDGQPVLLDPSYKAGDEIILPSAEHLPELTERYRNRADKLREHFSSRVGHPEHCAEVQLMYGDTLSELAEQKYGRKVNILALYEANQLPPRWVRNEQGNLTPLEPIYYAGHTYILPPVQDIDALAEAYRRKHFRR